LLDQTLEVTTLQRLRASERVWRILFLSVTGEAGYGRSGVEEDLEM